jgi:hypothetical protein
MSKETEIVITLPVLVMDYNGDEILCGAGLDYFGEDENEEQFYEDVYEKEEEETETDE